MHCRAYVPGHVYGPPPRRAVPRLVFRRCRYLRGFTRAVRRAVGALRWVGRSARRSRGRGVCRYVRRSRDNVVEWLSGSSRAVNVHTLLSHSYDVPSYLCLSPHPLYAPPSHSPLRPIRAEHAPHHAPRRAFVCPRPGQDRKGQLSCPYTLYTLYSGQLI